MPSPSPFRKHAGSLVAIAMLGSSAASAAPAPRMVDPLVVVSVFGTADSRAAICAAGSSAAAAAGTAVAAGQAPGAGCVLPVVDAPPPPVAEAPSAVAPIAPAATGVGALPILVGLAAVVGMAAIVLAHHDEDGEIDLPISP